MRVESGGKDGAVKSVESVESVESAGWLSRSAAFSIEISRGCGVSLKSAQTALPLQKCPRPPEVTGARRAV